MGVHFKRGSVPFKLLTLNFWHDARISALKEQKETTSALLQVTVACSDEAEFNHVKPSIDSIKETDKKIRSLIVPGVSFSNRDLKADLEKREKIFGILTDKGFSSIASLFSHIEKGMES